jgi:hypothetical protein
MLNAAVIETPHMSSLLPQCTFSLQSRLWLLEERCALAFRRQITHVRHTAPVAIYTPPLRYATGRVALDSAVPLRLLAGKFEHTTVQVVCHEQNWCVGNPAARQSAGRLFE